MWERPGAAILLGVATLALLCVPPAGIEAQALRRKADFTDKERAALDEGELVTRPATERRGSRKLFGGTSWQVVDLPPDAVWRAMHDLGRYHKMLPRVKRAREVASQGSVRTVHIKHDAANAHYFLDIRFSSARHDAFFQLDRNRPSSIRSAWGFMRVTEWNDGRSLLSFGIMADVGDGLVKGVLRPRVRKWMLRVPRTFKKYIEGKGRKRYRDS